MGGPPGTPANKSPIGGRILIVDDQDDVRLALQTLLSLDGWDTEEAASGEEAVSRVDATSDLAALVVDYRMPDLDGLEVTRRIRGSGFERPIIICSAYLNPELERAARALRAQTVSKDHLGDLRETIRRQIGADTPEEREQGFRPPRVAESSDAAIVDTTLEGIVESWNPAAERIYGYCAEEMIGRPAWLLVPAARDNDLPEILQKVGSGERIDDYKTAWEAKDGRLIDVSLAVSPVRDREGNIVGASTISRSATKVSQQRSPPPQPVGSWLDRRFPGPVTGIAVVLFAAVFALQVAVEDAGAAVILFNLAVALLALRFGLRGGLIGAAVAISLSLLATLLGALDIGLIGLLAQATGALLLGVLVGAYTDSPRAARNAEREDKSLASIVDSSDDAIIGETLEGTITSWNTGAERLYGYPPAEVVGKPIALLIPKERVDELPGIVERVRRGEVVDHYETVRRAKDGRLLEISLTVSPMKDAEGRITGASTIARDVSDRQRAERERRRLSAELEQRVRELDAANSELEAFSYSVSHDLRAPLRAVDGFSRAVIEDYGDKLDEDGRGLLEEIRAGSQRMGRLIDELLTLSQLTRRRLTPGSVDLSALADEIGSELGARAPERHVDLVIEEGLVTEGDSELLKIALRNLLENAWKFTAERTQPRIELRREAANGRSAYVVRDNGVGFDMRYSEKLFRPFERLHREDEFPGLGVGLATVQRVVRRHGGMVWAESRVDEGAAFFLDLPERESE